MILKVRIANLPVQRAVLLCGDDLDGVVVSLCGTNEVVNIPYTDICGLEFQGGNAIMFEVVGCQTKSLT